MDIPLGLPAFLGGLTELGKVVSHLVQCLTQVYATEHRSRSQICIHVNKTDPPSVTPRSLVHTVKRVDSKFGCSGSCIDTILIGMIHFYKESTPARLIAVTSICDNTI